MPVALGRAVSEPALHFLGQGEVPSGAKAWAATPLSLSRGQAWRKAEAIPGYAGQRAEVSGHGSVRCGSSALAGNTGKSCPGTSAVSHSPQSHLAHGEPSKTRTKDKYRVVYTDHQRLELEKEFHYSRYITIRRKSELAANLGLTERQVKIWFQNRRAKERKVNKKKQQQQQPPQPPTAHDITAAPAGPSLGGLCPGNTSLLGTSSPMPVKEEFLP
ncbi:hypothetical protein P7K49_003552 [Saguinus oedipus]|uniref:Homeobox domain-containing protein n=1 Tax=Saguinus oedipus TaxID=9490 RepID=A0ABQ9W4U9_SAGOE|nr:hypothetical protein P7K49_003552 [Saguinus oedipus]